MSWIGRDVERDALRIAQPLINELGQSVPMVGEGQITLDLQQRGVDLIVAHEVSGLPLFIEIKGSRKTYKSLFVETVQHRDTGNDGWIHTLQSDLMVWVYTDSKTGYIIKIPNLRRYYHQNKDKLHFVEPPDTKTIGCLIPWEILLSEAGIGPVAAQYIDFREADHYEQLLMMGL